MTIFRVHCIITGLFLAVVSIVLVVLSKHIAGFMLLNSMLILFGLLAVLVLDRDIPYGSYLTALYIFGGLVFAELAAFISMISFFQTHQLLYFLLLSIILVAGLYMFLPQLLRRSLAITYIPHGVWHTRNTLLLLSWTLFGLLLFFLF